MVIILQVQRYIYFISKKGNVKFTGTGIIKDTGTDYSPIKITGSTDENDKDYTVVTIDKDVIIEGGYGLLISHNNKKAYGLRIEFYGKSYSMWGGIYTNGSIQKGEKNNAIINVHDNAELNMLENDDESNGGIYAAGYAIWNIKKAKMSAYESGIAIKSGILNIDGAQIIATGPDTTPTSGFSNGIEGSGATIQIESNNRYAGNIEINIKSGTFISYNGVNIYEYINGADDLAIKTINISGGTFKSGTKIQTSKKCILTSKEFTKSNLNEFITSGIFSTDVKENIKAGYREYVEDNNYYVEKITMKEGTLKISGTTEFGATVRLTNGSQLLKIVVADSEGKYEIENLEKGLYNLIFYKDSKSTIKMVNLTENKIIDANIPTGSIKVTIVGEKTKDMIVEGLENVNDIKDVKLIISTSDKDENGAKAIKEEAKDKNVDFVGLTLYEETTILETTTNILHFTLNYDFNNKNNIVVYRYHDGKVDAFTKLDEEPITYEDGTYYLDETTGLVHLFSNKFSTYAIAYETPKVDEKKEDNPNTGDNIITTAIIASVSIIVAVGCILVIKKR